MQQGQVSAWQSKGSATLQPITCASSGRRARSPGKASIRSFLICPKLALENKAVKTGNWQSCNSAAGGERQIKIDATDEDILFWRKNVIILKSFFHKIHVVPFYVESVSQNIFCRFRKYCSCCLGNKNDISH